MIPNYSNTLNNKHSLLLPKVFTVNYNKEDVCSIQHLDHYPTTVTTHQESIFQIEK